MIFKGRQCITIIQLQQTLIIRTPLKLAHNKQSFLTFPRTFYFLYID